MQNGSVRSPVLNTVKVNYCLRKNSKNLAELVVLDSLKNGLSWFDVVGNNNLRLSLNINLRVKVLAWIVILFCSISTIFVYLLTPKLMNLQGKCIVCYAICHLPYLLVWPGKKYFKVEDCSHRHSFKFYQIVSKLIKLIFNIDLQKNYLFFTTTNQIMMMKSYKMRFINFSTVLEVFG